MAFEASQCGALTNSCEWIHKRNHREKDLRLAPCSRTHGECHIHTDFYEPTRWLRWLDAKTQGWVAPWRERLQFHARDPYWAHMRDALRHGHVVIRPEHLKKLPTYMYTAGEQGEWLALFLYETQSEICRTWSPRLWERVARHTFGRWHLDSSRKPRLNYSAILKHLIRTVDDLYAYLTLVENAWGSSPDFCHMVLRSNLASHPEWAFDARIRALAEEHRHEEEIREAVSFVEERSRTMAKTCVEAIREELMAAAWRPERFIDWCVDTNERVEWVC